MAQQDSTESAARAMHLWLNYRLGRHGLHCYDFLTDLSDGVLLLSLVQAEEVELPSSKQAGPGGPASAGGVIGSGPGGPAGTASAGAASTAVVRRLAPAVRPGAPTANVRRLLEYLESQVRPPHAPQAFVTNLDEAPTVLTNCLKESPNLPRIPR